MSGRPVFIDPKEVDFVDSEGAAERRRRLVAFASFTHWLFAVLALLVLLSPNVSCAEEQASDSEIYHRAVDYCRGPVLRADGVGLRPATFVL